MTNESKIREILLKHNEWNCYDDEIEEGYGTVEYHTESLEKVVKDLSQLLTPSQDSSQHDSELLGGFVVGLKEQFAKHIVTETYDESKGEEIDGEVAMNVDKALSQAGPEIIDLFFQDWKEKKEL